MTATTLMSDAWALDEAMSSDERVVACAAALFLVDGIEGVKMVDIARDAKVGVATLYRHFQTKAGLAACAARRMWRALNDDLAALAAHEEYRGRTGLQRLETLLGAYVDVFDQNPGFATFLDEFDRLVLTGQVGRDGLELYERELTVFYPRFFDAYELGLLDGSVRRRVDFKTFYRALAHALMGVAARLRRGEVVSSDRLTTATQEMRALVNMAVWSLESDEES